VVFMFVAIWHDLELHLLAWAWILTIFLLPEIVASRIQNTAAFKVYFEQRPLLETVVYAMAGAANIMILKAANIVGYTIGLDAIGLLVPIIYTYEGLKLLLWYYSIMVCGVMLMRYIRQHENTTLTKTD